jgi:hypothetical protein
MIFLQMIKGLFIALTELWRKLWRTSGKKVKWTLALLVVALVTMFAVNRYREAFVDKPPEWLQQRNFTSPPLPSATGEQFKLLVDLADRYSKQRFVPLGSVRLWEIQSDLKETIFWSTDEFKNAGFNPLNRVERTMKTEPQRFIGYYTRAGRPLDYTVRRSPSQPKDLLLTVHLPDPIAPGASVVVFRMVRQTDFVKKAKNGSFHSVLGSMPNPELAIHLWAVRFPEGVTLVRHTPETGASVSNDKAVQVSWVNARIASNAPPLSVVYSMPKSLP